MTPDPLRPSYHFLPPKNWMNDPNGLIQWEGEYHHFYQYNPSEAAWGNIHWGHAKSADLVHWQNLPVALSPTVNSPDQNGCWSGSAVDHNGIPTLIYTGVKYKVSSDDYTGKSEELIESVCIATSRNDLVNWKKYDNNPVIGSPPHGLDTVGFRDPYVWNENGKWYLVIGSGIKDQGGCILLYSSNNLHKWEYLGRLFTVNTKEHGPMFECPSFFSLGGMHVLTVGAKGKAKYFVGTYKDYKFVPSSQGTLDYGIYYSPQVMVDKTGRRIMFGWTWEGGWSWEGRDNEILKAAGWAGVSPLPRILSLTSDQRIIAKPVPELKVLREDHTQYSDIALNTEIEIQLPIQSNRLEILTEIELINLDEFGIQLCCSPDKSEMMTVGYRSEDKTFFASSKPATRLSPSDMITHSASLHLKEGETLKLQIFLDRSIVEVFAHDQCSITTRFYPRQYDSLSIKLYSAGGKLTLKSLDIWQLKSIWNNH